MAWVVQNMHPGPLEVRDLNLIFSGNQIRDLDIVGRENAERSNDIKYLMSKEYIRQIRKDPGPPPANMSGVQQVVEQASKASQEAKIAAESLAAKLSKENEELRKQMGDMESAQKLAAEEGSKKMDQVLELVRAFAQAHPAEARAAAQAMRNIKEEEKALDDQASKAEIEAHSKILEMKKKQLRQNMDNLGKTVSQSSGDHQEALDAMDQLDL